jgi:DNA repair protein RadA/Sms
LNNESGSQNSKFNIQNSTPAASPVSFSSVSSEGTARIPTGITEVDRVLGGGMVPGMVMLLSGEPGNGKSTLAAHLVHSVRQGEGYKVQGTGTQKALYVSGEESAEQVKLRLERLGVNLERVNFLGQTDARIVAATITAERPSLAIIDSIQTMRTAEGSGEAGSLGQVRASAAILTEAAKQTRVPTIIIGQVTKEGSAAGPKSLEHLVDVVLTLEGDRESQYRVLRAEKNRFGSTDEIGVFLMTDRGMKEVSNPSELFVRERSRLAGSCMTCVLEGSRAMLVEVQALAHPTAYGNPIRRASGLDINRLQMICAVLASRARVPLAKADVHVNVVGGIKLREPAADLAVAMAIVSAVKNTALATDVCAFGELGLGGELRSVRGTDRRITESLRFGLKHVVAPPDVKTVSDALRFV